MKKTKRILALSVASALAIGTGATAFAAIPVGTVVIGSKAFDITYANTHSSDIQQAIINGAGKIFIKGFSGSWVNNANQAVNSDVIPAVTYTDRSGTALNYLANDGVAVGTPVTGDLKVESVSAINAKEIKVTFNKEVNKASAIDETNYQFVVNTTVVAASVFEGTSHQKGMLTDDKKSVVFRINDLDLVSGSTPDFLANAYRYSVNVSTNVVGTDYKSVEKYVDSVHTFNDVTAPKLVETTVDASAKTLTFEFDEPVNEVNMVVKVDGVNVSDNTDSPDVIGNITQDDTREPMNYLLNTDAINSHPELFTAGTHNVVIYNTKDVLNANANAASVINTSYTITEDKDAPKVLGVKIVNSRSFLVTFNELIQTPAAANFVVKKGNHTFGSSDILVHEDLKADSTGKTYRVSVREQADYLSGTSGTKTDNPLYGDAETSATLSVTAKDYKDLSNILGVPTTNAVTLTADTKTPELVGTVANTIDAATQKLKVRFDGNIDSATVDHTKIVVKNKDGIALTNIESADIVVNNDIVSIDLDANAVSLPLFSVLDAPYTVEFKAGAVKYAKNTNDDEYSVNANKNNALVATVNASASADAVVVEAAAIIGGTTVAIDGKITITYVNDMDASAVNPANYAIDGVALNSNTKATFVGGKKIVELTLPESKFDKTQTAKLTIATSVKTKEGSLVVSNALTKEAVEKIMTFTDNTKPVVSKVEFYVPSNTATETNQLKVTFSEDMKASTLTADDFKLTVNGNKVNINNIIAGNKASEAIVTLANNVSVNNTNVVFEAIAKGVNNAAMDTQDAATNELTAGTANVTAKVLKPTVAMVPTAPTSATIKPGTSIADSKFNIADQATNDEAVTVVLPQNSGTNGYEAGDMIKVYNGSTEIGSYTLVSGDITTLTSGTLTKDIVVKDHFDAIADGTVTLTAKVKDVNAESVGANTTAIVVDLTAPTKAATLAVVLTTNTVVGNDSLAATDVVTIKFSEVLTTTGLVLNLQSAVDTAFGTGNAIVADSGDHKTFTITVDTGKTVTLTTAGKDITITNTNIVDANGNQASANVVFHVED